MASRKRSSRGRLSELSIGVSSGRGRHRGKRVRLQELTDLSMAWVSRKWELTSGQLLPRAVLGVQRKGISVHPAEPITRLPVQVHHRHKVKAFIFDAVNQSVRKLLHPHLAHFPLEPTVHSRAVQNSCDCCLNRLGKPAPQFGVNMSLISYGFQELYPGALVPNQAHAARFSAWMSASIASISAMTSS